MSSRRAWVAAGFIVYHSSRTTYLVERSTGRLWACDGTPTWSPGPPVPGRGWYDHGPGLAGLDLPFREKLRGIMANCYCYRGETKICDYCSGARSPESFDRGGRP